MTTAWAITYSIIVGFFDILVKTLNSFMCAIKQHTERVFLYSKTGSRQQYNPRSWHWPLQKKSVMVVTGDLINNQVVGYLMWDTVISMGQISCLQAVYYCFRHVRKGHRSNTPRFWGETLQSSTEAVRAYNSCGCKSITIWTKCNDLRQIIRTGKTKRDKSGICWSGSELDQAESVRTWKNMERRKRWVLQNIYQWNR